jgi:hypothetical protein
MDESSEEFACMVRARSENNLGVRGAIPRRGSTGEISLLSHATCNMDLYPFVGLVIYALQYDHQLEKRSNISIKSNRNLP